MKPSRTIYSTPHIITPAPDLRHPTEKNAAASPPQEILDPRRSALPVSIAAPQAAIGEELFRTVIQGISLPVAIIDSHFRIVFWNKAAETASGGLTAESVLGKEIERCLPLQQ